MSGWRRQSTRSATPSHVLAATSPRMTRWLPPSPTAWTGQPAVDRARARIAAAPGGGGPEDFTVLMAALVAVDSDTERAREAARGRGQPLRRVSPTPTTTPCCAARYERVAEEVDGGPPRPGGLPAGSHRRGRRPVTVAAPRASAPGGLASTRTWTILLVTWAGCATRRARRLGRPPRSAGLLRTAAGTGGGGVSRPPGVPAGAGALSGGRGRTAR